MLAKLIFSVIFLFLSTPSWATWTKVQEASNTCTDGSSDQSCTVTMGQAIGSGHLIVCAFNNTGSDTYSSMSCNSSGCGTWVHATTADVTNSAQGVTGFFAYVLSSTSGATTITQTYGGGSSVFYRAVFCAEYSFTGSSTAFDSGNTVDGESSFSGGNTTGVALTLTGTNDVLFQQYTSQQSAVTPSAISGAYSDILDTTQSKSGFAAAKNTTTGTAPVWTTSSAHYTENAVGFNEVSSAAVITTTINSETLKNATLN